MKLQTVIAMLNNEQTRDSNFSQSYRIYYEDTDAQGVVYYANYLKFFERARTDYLRNIGISQSKLIAEENIIFVVRRCEIDYFRPAKLDDMLDIDVQIKEVTSTRIKMLQNASTNSKILTSLNVEIVCVDNINYRPTAIPQNLKQILENHVR